LPFLAIVAAMAPIGLWNSAAAEALSFAWPAPVTAEITLETEKNGRAVRTLLLLDVTRERTSGLYRMDYRDVKILAIDGRDLSSPGMQAKLPARIKTVARAMPSFLVSPDGTISEFIALEALLETIIEHTADDSAGVMEEQLRKVLFSPQMQQVIRAKAADDWNAWVGIWAGKDLAPGRRLEFRTGSKSTAQQFAGSGYFENLGPVGGRSGAVKLRMELTMEGPEFRRALYQMLAAMAEGSGQDMGDFSADRIKQARRVQRVEAVTDPKTLRPYSINASVEMTFGVEGKGETQRRVETKRFKFDWSDH
jgi:hypothetical protein